MNMMSTKEIGIGKLLASGMTLKQHRDAIIERTKTTGYYNGLEKLELRDSDPIGYEKLFEGESYLRELSGEAKQKESLWGLMQTLRRVRRIYGRVQVNFGGSGMKWLALEYAKLTPV